MFTLVILLRAFTDFRDEEMEDFDNFLLCELSSPNIGCSDPAGYSTPMTPIHLDYPSITPMATVLDLPAPKRQRAISDVGPMSTCSFDLYDELDFQQMYDSFDGEYSLLAPQAVITSKEMESSTDEKPKKEEGNPEGRPAQGRYYQEEDDLNDSCVDPTANQEEPDLDKSLETQGPK